MDAQTTGAIERVIEEIGGSSEPASDPTLSLADDLGFDSLDMIELVLVLEERFLVTLDDHADENWRTVGDVLSAMSAALPVPQLHPADL